MKDKTHECEMHEGDILIAVCILHMYPEGGQPTSSPAEELSSRSPEAGSDSTLGTTRSSTDGPLNSVKSFPPDRGTTDKETQDAEQRLTTEPGQYWVPEHGIRIESALGKVVRRMPAELEDYSSCQLYRGKMTSVFCDMYQGTSGLVTDEESYISTVQIWEYAFKMGTTVKVSDVQELESHLQGKTMSSLPDVDYQRVTAYTVAVRNPQVHDQDQDQCLALVDTLNTHSVGQSAFPGDRKIEQTTPLIKFFIGNKQDCHNKNETCTLFTPVTLKTSNGCELTWIKQKRFSPCEKILLFSVFAP